MPIEIVGARPDIADGINLGLAGQHLEPDELYLDKRHIVAVVVDRPAEVVTRSAAGAIVKFSELGQAGGGEVALAQGRIHRQPEVAAAIGRVVSVDPPAPASGRARTKPHRRR